MIEPNGPLPPAVYWRRRVVAVGGTAIALVLIVLLLSWGADDSVTPSANNSGKGAVAESSPPPAGQQLANASSSSSASAEPSLSASVSAGGSSAAASSASSAASSSKPKPKPKPKPCAESTLKLLVQLGKPEYRVGERPEMNMVLTNAGQDPCVQDVSRQVRELVVTAKDSGDRLWSSLDCYPPKTNEKPVLQPGQQLSFELSWAGRTSAPGCPVNRETVPAGEYLVTAKIGKLASEPVPLRLR
ncbi:hypothetical protein EV191_101647 [Tamaricihabitans halophyticus]|uniref:Uncharacterized protein n=1 Tax=Tamaricihabitans halophyticus TaxID=1262583 RepID=A0A4R2RAG7_9PSEU|nr:hypothetical protein [Tamaricihabitans halophyticus]TCP56701.1 hypothetical protein EV191_101647 [Tamaricihabitans halophyticus]